MEINLEDQKELTELVEFATNRLNLDGTNSADDANWCLIQGLNQEYFNRYWFNLIESDGKYYVMGVINGN